MSRKKRETGQAQSSSKVVRDVVEVHSTRQLPVINRLTHINKLAESIQWFRHSRQLYVVDDENRLLGIINLECLVRHFFTHHHGANTNPRHLLSIITTETAEDLMLQNPLSVRLDDRVEDVLKRMVTAHVEEVPVTDDEGHVIADLTMIDLLMAE
jgi:CBS domain-containing protein